MENICIGAEILAATLQQSSTESEPVAAETCLGNVVLEGAAFKDSDAVESEDMGHSSSNEEIIAGNGDAYYVPCLLVVQSHTSAEPVMPFQQRITVRLAFCAEDTWQIKLKSRRTLGLSDSKNFISALLVHIAQSAKVLAFLQCISKQLSMYLPNALPFTESKLSIN